MTLVPLVLMMVPLETRYNLGMLELEPKSPKSSPSHLPWSCSHYFEANENVLVTLVFLVLKP